MGPEAMEHAARLLRYKDRAPYQAYVNGPGEKYALAAQRRYLLSPEERKMFDPHENVLKGINDEPDAEFSAHLLDALERARARHQDPSSYVPNALRKWGTIR
jgi:hypothetical protein